MIEQQSIYRRDTGCAKKSERHRMRQKFFELLKILDREQPQVAHVVETCTTHKTHVIICVPAVIKTWGDATTHESLAVRHGQWMGVTHWYHRK